MVKFDIIVRMGIDQIRKGPVIKEGLETGLVKKFEKVSTFELLNMDQLNDDERSCVTEALRVQKRSDNEFVLAGSAVMAYNGQLIASHNDIPGEHGHAEQQAIRKLYAGLPVGQQKLKILALAACLAGEEVIRESTPYDQHIKFNEVKAGWPCGQCLSFIDSCTASLDREQGEDVEILVVTATGQVMRTFFYRDLMPPAWQSVRVRRDPHGGPAVFEGSISGGK